MKRVNLSGHLTLHETEDVNGEYIRFEDYDKLIKSVMEKLKTAKYWCLSLNGQDEIQEIIKELKGE